MQSIALLLAIIAATYSRGFQAEILYEAMPDQVVCHSEPISVKLKFIGTLPPNPYRSCHSELLVSGASLTGTCQLRVGPKNKTEHDLSIQAYRYTIKARLDAMPEMTFTSSYEGYAIGKELEDLAEGVLLGEDSELLVLQNCPSRGSRALH